VSRSAIRLTAVWAVTVLVVAALLILTLHPRRPSASRSDSIAAAASATATVTTALVPLAVTLTDKGCATSPASVSTGPVDITVVNPGKTVVSEAELWSGNVMLGEREGVAVGSPESFALRLAPGVYKFVCPGPISTPTTLRVTSPVP
jgi:iron uptake system component EfeO